MPVERASDRAIFVSSAEFGAIAAWRTADGLVVTFDAIFDDEYQLLASEIIEGGMEGSLPHLLCRSSDLPADAAQDDLVQISRVDEFGATVPVGAYRAVEFRPDGTGMTDVRLREA